MTEDMIGWFGLKVELMNYLESEGADKDEDGKFILTGGRISIGFDEEEVLIPADTGYMVKGVARLLASRLRATPHGVSVGVF